MMVTCSVCGGLNSPNNRVCEHCGSDLMDESEEISYFEDDNRFSDSSDDNDNYYIDDDDY